MSENKPSEGIESTLNSSDNAASNNVNDEGNAVAQANKEVEEAMRETMGEKEQGNNDTVQEAHDLDETDVDSSMLASEAAVSDSERAMSD